jgi:pimeloyl-ACP methyl ester carboxylesterase
VAYRETKCEEAKLDVLFLHGRSFKSEVWVSKPLWTLQLLYKTGGFRAVAIDLPGNKHVYYPSCHGLLIVTEAFEEAR